FRLTELDLVNWPSFDSFFNACLLGRLPREFEIAQPRFKFFGSAEEDELDPYDPELSTSLRILTRDERDPVAPRFPQVPTIDDPDLWNAYGGTDPIQQLKAESGTAGWNDFSWLSNAARASLQRAAGISVPRREFV